MVLVDRSDVRTLLHVALCAAAAGPALWHSFWWWPGYAFLALHVVSVQHNHAHRPVFRARAANIGFDVLTALLCGIPMFCWRTHHLRSHHIAPWTADDWSSPYRFTGTRSPDRPVGYRFYQVTYLPYFVRDSVRWIVRHGSRQQRRALAVTGATLVTASAVLAWSAGPWRWLAVVVPAYAICGCGLGAINYLQHYNTWLPQHGEFGAWTFTCRWHNLLNYNLGYHQLHHRQPHLHWSRLAKVHAADPSYAPTHLVEHGLFPGYRTNKARQAWLLRHGTPGEFSASSRTERAR